MVKKSIKYVVVVLLKYASTKITGGEAKPYKTQNTTRNYYGTYTFRLINKG